MTILNYIRLYKIILIKSRLFVKHYITLISSFNDGPDL